MKRQKQDHSANVSSESITEAKAIEFAPFGYFTLNSSGLICDLNPFGARLLGKEKTDLLGRSFEQFIIPEYSEIFHHCRNALIETGADQECEIRVFHPRRQSFPVRLNLALIKCCPAVQILLFIADISEQKDAVNEILRTNERLKLAQEVSGSGTWDWDIVHDRYYWSEELLLVFGLQQDVTTGFEAWMKILHPDDLDPAMSRIQEALQNGENLDSEYRIILPDGQVRWISAIGRTIYKENKPVRMLGLCTDITAHKLTQQMLQQSEANLLGILNATSESILLFDIQGHVLLANQTAVSRMKATADKIIGRSLFELWPKGLAASRFKAITEAVRTGQPVYHEDIRDGIIFEHTFYPVAGPGGKINRVVAFSRDITERKRSEQALIKSYDELELIVKKRTSELQKTNEILKNEIEERIKAERILKESQSNLRALSNRMQAIAEEERTRMAREIHDELGHLLTALKFDIENLSGDPYSPSNTMLNELESMKSMVDLLIDSVRKIATELRPGILDHLGLLPAIEWQINQFRIRTKIKCECFVSDMELNFDKNENIIIYRIMQEILTNIARHSKADAVGIRVERLNDRFFLQVTDNGNGFKVMEISPSESLGLLGMRERAISIGGELQIESAPGQGCTITLTVNDKKDSDEMDPGVAIRRKPGKMNIAKPLKESANGIKRD